MNKFGGSPVESRDMRTNTEQVLEVLESVKGISKSDLLIDEDGNFLKQTLQIGIMPFGNKEVIGTLVRIDSDNRAAGTKTGTVTILTSKGEQQYSAVTFLSPDTKIRRI